MLGWLRKLFLNAEEHAQQLQMLEQQASNAREQLNASLQLALTTADPETKVTHLELAKAQFAELQAIAARHPGMRLTNVQEVDAAITQLERAFARNGIYAMAEARRRQHASVHVSLSAQSRALLRSGRSDA